MGIETLLDNPSYTSKIRAESEASHFRWNVRPEENIIEPAYVARLEQRMQRLEDVLLSLGVPASTRSAVTVGDVVAWIALQTGCSVSEITGQRRQFAIARARFAVYWLGIHALQLSLPAIGSKLSKRDHTTVLHGVRRADELRLSDPAFRMMTDKGLRHFIAQIADAIIRAAEQAEAEAAEQAAPDIDVAAPAANEEMN